MLTGHSASCARFASAITIAIRSSNRKLEHKNIFEAEKSGEMQTRDSWTSQRRREYTTRRAHMRYPLRILVGYRWRDSHGAKRGGKGWTRNLSEEGAFVQTRDCPAEHEDVDLFLRIPRLRTSSIVSAMRMTMEGRVVRVERNTEQGIDLGFAIQKRRGVSSDDGDAQELAGTRGRTLPPRVN
jgi:hypothetical protein